MPTAFVLSGGTSLGAIHVGMLRALVEEEITPDLIVGTSVGAVNGGWIASRKDIFPTHPITGLMGFVGHRSHLVPNNGLRRWAPTKSGYCRPATRATCRARQ